jgi:hypothetical protein
MPILIHGLRPFPATSTTTTHGTHGRSISRSHRFPPPAPTARPPFPQHNPHPASPPSLGALSRAPLVAWPGPSSRPTPAAGSAGTTRETRVGTIEREGGRPAGQLNASADGGVHRLHVWLLAARVSGHRSLWTYPWLKPCARYTVAHRHPETLTDLHSGPGIRASERESE